MEIQNRYLSKITDYIILYGAGTSKAEKRAMNYIAKRIFNEYDLLNKHSEQRVCIRCSNPVELVDNHHCKKCQTDMSENKSNS